MIYTGQSSSSFSSHDSNNCFEGKEIKKERKRKNDISSVSNFMNVPEEQEVKLHNYAACYLIEI